MEYFKGLLGLVVCCLFANCASSHMISREVLSASSGRVLMADKPPFQRCKINFMKRDYSALAACNTPFPRKACCDGFKEIACPAVRFINDMRTDCATNMFIGIYDYKPSLPYDYFNENCIEGPHGLDCLPVFKRLKKHASKP